MLDELTSILAREQMKGPMDDERPRQLESLYTWCLERLEQGGSADDLRRVLIDLDLDALERSPTVRRTGLGTLAALMLEMDLSAFSDAGVRRYRSWLSDPEIAIQRRCRARVGKRGQSQQLLQAARALLEKRDNIATTTDLAKVNKAKRKMLEYPGECFQDAMDRCQDEDVGELLRRTWRSLPVYVQQRRKRRR